MCPSSSDQRLKDTRSLASCIASADLTPNKTPVLLKNGGSLPADGQLGRQGPALSLRHFPSYAAVTPRPGIAKDVWTHATFNLAGTLPDVRNGQPTRGQVIDRSLHRDVTINLYPNPYMRDDILDEQSKCVSAGFVPTPKDEYGSAHQVGMCVLYSTLPSCRAADNDELVPCLRMLCTAHC